MWERGVKDGSKIFDMSKWKKGVTIRRFQMENIWGGMGREDSIPEVLILKYLKLREAFQ